MAIQPGPASQGGQGPGQSDTAELDVRGNRHKRRPVVALLLAFLGLAGLGYAALGISVQLAPRTFTAAQRQRIEAWEVASRWRTIPKAQIFPMVVHYRLAGDQIGSAGELTLGARRLEIARPAGCISAAGASSELVTLLQRGRCQAMLRATYVDASASLVLTVGVVVLGTDASASTAAHLLTGAVASRPAGVAGQLVLDPVAVPGTPAATFGLRQRQLSWVVSAGPYLVMATAGFADGRPHLPLTSDTYTYLEMTGLVHGVAAAIATSLGAPPPAPRCPGGPAC